MLGLFIRIYSWHILALYLLMTCIFLHYIYSWPVYSCTIFTHDPYILALYLLITCIFLHYIYSWPIYTCTIFTHDPYILALYLLMTDKFLHYIYSWPVYSCTIFTHDLYILALYLLYGELCTTTVIVGANSVDSHDDILFHVLHAHFTAGWPMPLMFKGGLKPATCRLPFSYFTNWAIRAPSTTFKIWF